MQILSGRYGPAFAFVTISVVALLTYSNSLHGPFLLDDRPFILNNSELRDIKNFLDIAGTRYIAFLSFALNYAAGGYETFGYHLINLIIHAINGLLVWWLVLLTFKTPVMERSSIAPQEKYFIALGSALLFISHPIQTQAVTYITNRFVCLATLFYLLSLVLFVKWQNSYGTPDVRMRSIFYILSLLSALLAMKTKAISFTLPFIIILYERTFFKRTDKPEPSPRRRKLISHLTPFILTLTIIPLTLLGQGPGERALRNGFIGEIMTIPTYDYLMTQFRVIVTYLRLLIFPANQHMNYDYPIFHSILEPQVFLSFLFISSITGLAIYLLKRSRKTRNGYGLLTSFGILWFFITLSVESITPLKEAAAEHRLYLPSAGIIPAFAATLCFIFDATGNRFNMEAVKKTGSLAVILAMVFVFSVATHIRNKVWRDEIAFYLDDAKKSPNEPNVHNNLGGAYYKKGLLDKAIGEYKLVLELKPDHAPANFILGVIYMKKGLKKEAIREFKKALEARPDFEEARKALERVLAQEGGHE
jgi:hypothetical protein